MSNLWSPALYFNGHENVTHETFSMKILGFEKGDDCNNALDAARERISSRKKAETQFQSKTFLIFLNWYQDDIFILEIPEEQSLPLSI